MKRLTPRQRFLLDAAFEGRLWMDHLGAFWLDKTSRVTREFKPLIDQGWARRPLYQSADPMRRVLWIAEEAWPSAHPIEETER